MMATPSQGRRYSMAQCPPPQARKNSQSSGTNGFEYDTGSCTLLEGAHIVYTVNYGVNTNCDLSIYRELQQDLLQPIGTPGPLPKAITRTIIYAQLV